MKEFYSLHPEFNPVARKAKAKGRRPGVHSPFNAYRDTLTSGESHHVAQKMWKDLHPEEKVKFIKLIANMDTAEKKVISKDEWKILEQEGFNGMPKKPNNAYQLFVADFAKTYTGERKRMIEVTAVAWKNLGEVKKKIYNEKHDEAIEKFRVQLKKYIKGLPKDKQPLMMQKFKKELGEERKRKNSNNETILDDTKSEPPKKKKKKDREEKPMKIKQSPSTNDYEELLVEAPKKKNKEVESPQKKKEVESPEKKKIKKNGESSQESFKKDKSSPKKKPVLSSDESEEKVFGSKKKSKSKALVFPSQTTAHYFMTRIYKGNRKNITEAYKSLSKSMKAKYFSEMKREKQKFLETVAEYIKTASPEEVVDVKLKSKATKQQQLKELGWHKEKGTDDESRARPSSDSSSDSDSS